MLWLGDDLGSEGHTYSQRRMASRELPLLEYFVRTVAGRSSRRRLILDQKSRRPQSVIEGDDIEEASDQLAAEAEVVVGGTFLLCLLELQITK